MGANPTVGGRAGGTRPERGVARGVGSAGAHPYRGAMTVAIIGGHGQVARHLTRLLVARNTAVRAVIRNPDHRADVEADGATAVVCDIEDSEADVAGALGDSDAVVFAAGAGPGSGPERKVSVDQRGVEVTLAAAREAGIDRYVVISAMGTDDPPGDDEVFSVYLRAKAAADAAVRAAGVAHTIVRPGRLTDDPGTGHVTLARHVAPGAIPRADVAAVVADALADPGTIGHTVEVVGGPTPIAEAVAGVAGLPADPT